MSDDPKKRKGRKKKRAIALAGGGPAAGLHIGALQALEDAGIEFDVFTLSCIGAWVGIVYNTRTPGKRAKKTLDFFSEYCFRDDASFSWFPVNRGFAADMQAQWKAWAGFPFSNKREWHNLVQPQEILKSMRNSMQLAADPGRWSAQHLNYWMLNDVLAVHPFTRYMTSLVYSSEINGLSKIYYDDSPVLKDVFSEDRLFAAGAPEVYHNAWRLPKDGQPGFMQIFHNRPDQVGDGKRGYLPIEPRSLCACSALPYIEESVTIGEHEYTEGALVDTVNFKNLLRDHPDLDEVWVNRIVDDSQVRPARSLADSLANLPMQFAAEVGENDIKLFRQHLLNQTRMRPRVVEVPIVPRTQVTFEWKRSNLMQGYEEGQRAIAALLASDEHLRNPQTA
ncbi:patatin-like phospholipase family protein [Variovorax sp. OV329]|uniref:patatin-like phospholipase family protein n=1 Tax=Variovorax sp. OV329 TaxID=1882825 RepID=UPI0008ED6C0B|nr:patatin-like phospholipase family protein [Variovorax sp. OV329]SFM82625.1 Patatin-like phospholipase [Variovorax sp. OV329]